MMPHGSTALQSMPHGSTALQSVGPEQANGVSKLSIAAER